MTTRKEARSKVEKITRKRRTRRTMLTRKSRRKMRTRRRHLPKEREAHEKKVKGCT